MTSSNEVYTFILVEATHDDLQRFDWAIKNRKELLADTLQVGSRVRLTAIRPKYMEGRTCTIVRRKTKTFVVRFDHPLPGRFAGQNELTVPESCLVPLS